MSEQTLPGIKASSVSPTAAPSPASPPRLLRAERRQIRLLPTDLESLLPDDHPARSIWTLVEKLDLSAFENSIKSRGEGAGRPAIDPRILVTLWVFATSEGVGSARELEKLCGVHDAYRWISGGVPVCAHTLSDFRVAHPQALDDLLTRLLAVLKNQGLVELKRVAQDGMKVRASAGAASFRSGDADPHQPRPDDPPAIADWRRRMATAEAKEIYKQRAATAETSNANLKCLKGLDRFRVRTAPKVRCVVLWAVLAYDLLRWISMT